MGRRPRAQRSTLSLSLIRPILSATGAARLPRACAFPCASLTMGTGEALLSYGFPLLLVAGALITLESMTRRSGKSTPLSSLVSDVSPLSLGSLCRISIPSFIYLVCFAITSIWSPHPLLSRRSTFRFPLTHYSPASSTSNAFSFSIVPSFP